MNDNEWEEILQRFVEEGLDPELADNRKLLYVWRWLVDAETNCISLRHQLDKLGRKQADELREIRSCMEQMCNSWEKKVSNLEEENRRFQEQLNLTSQTSENYVAKDIHRMLINDGLHEILHMGILEQFAFLLDERVRLSQLVEREREARRKCEQLAHMVSNLPDCVRLSSLQIQRMLDRQKEEYEDELRHQQETMKQVKEQLRAVHEDELKRMNNEAISLKNELSKSNEKIHELVSHIEKQLGQENVGASWVKGILDGSFEKEMTSIKSEREHLKALCQEYQNQICEQRDTLILIERTNKQLELDNDTLAYKLSECLTQIDELEEQLIYVSARNKGDSPTYDKMDSKYGANKFSDSRPNKHKSYLEGQENKGSEGSPKMLDQLQSVQRQLEILSMKYQQHKDKYRDKLIYFKNLKEHELQEWKNRFESSQKELSTIRSMLTREQKWRLEVEASDGGVGSSSSGGGGGNVQSEREQQPIIDSGSESSSPQSNVPVPALPLAERAQMTHTPRQVHFNTSRNPKNYVWPLITYSRKW